MRVSMIVNEKMRSRKGRKETTIVVVIELWRITENPRLKVLLKGQDDNNDQSTGNDGS